MRATVADTIDAQHGRSSIESTLPSGSRDPWGFFNGDADDVESVWLAHDTEAERTLNGKFGEEHFVNCQASVTAMHNDGQNEIEETDILGGIDANTDVRVLQGLALRRPADVMYLPGSDSGNWNVRKHASLSNTVTTTGCQYSGRDTTSLCGPSLKDRLEVVKESTSSIAESRAADPMSSPLQSLPRDVADSPTHGNGYYDADRLEKGVFESYAVASLMISPERSTPAANSNRAVSTPQHTSSLPVLGGVAFAAVAGIGTVFFYLYSFRS
ncbi:hypothetical protein LTR66_006441 [Elasticomyces elasticus]|nr:hypothetical protein LTR66_006441 [Elasticomyces elasticus]KAK5008565.1 hypothetical protein LTR28_003803 [Elasticomyces elasticus]